jgi:hypothetical protein
VVPLHTPLAHRCQQQTGQPTTPRDPTPSRWASALAWINTFTGFPSTTRDLDAWWHVRVANQLGKTALGGAALGVLPR